MCENIIPIIKLCLLSESFSGNKYHKAHWTVYSKDKSKYLNWCYRMQAIVQHPQPCTIVKHVDFVCFRRRELDDDNLRSGLKGLRDCFKEVGWIVDDNPRWATFTYSQYKIHNSIQGGKPCIQITISPKAEGLQAGNSFNYMSELKS